MMVGGRNNRKGLESWDVCCRRDAADERLQKINLAARLGEASEMPERLVQCRPIHRDPQDTRR